MYFFLILIYAMQAFKLLVSSLQIIPMMQIVKLLVISMFIVHTILIHNTNNSITGDFKAHNLVTHIIQIVKFLVTSTLVR